ncbi:hypothetical protein Tco_0501935 [Tanacetum coccineum]
MSVQELLLQEKLHKALQAVCEKLNQQEQAANVKPEDSLIMGDKNLSTIPEKESDEFIKSSVKNLVPIPSESEDTSDNDKGGILLLEKLLNNDPSSPLPLKELNFEELKVKKYDVSTDFEDDYYDSEGDIIYLESLLIKDTIPNLPPEVFLDRDPRTLEDEPDNDDLESMVKVFDPEIHKKIISLTYVPDIDKKDKNKAK